jgi:hypothetical protein
MVKRRKNLSKITKQQDSLQYFFQKPGVCENCGWLIIEPCSAAITMNLGTSSHGNGVILPQNQLLYSSVGFTCMRVLANKKLMHTLKNLTSCSKSANKPSTSCVRTACPKLSTSLEQAVNNL